MPLCLEHPLGLIFRRELLSPPDKTQGTERRMNFTGHILMLF